MIVVERAFNSCGEKFPTRPATDSGGRAPGNAGRRLGSNARSASVLGEELGRVSPRNRVAAFGRIVPRLACRSRAEQESGHASSVGGRVHNPLGALRP